MDWQMWLRRALLDAAVVSVVSVALLLGYYAYQGHQAFVFIAQQLAAQAQAQRSAPAPPAK